MKTKIKKIEAIAITAIIAISVFAGVMLVMAVPSATPDDTGTPDTVVPDETYIAYNITYQENNSAGETDGALLTWFNVTEMNQSISNIGDINNIVNITVTNATTPSIVLGYNSTTPFNAPIWVNLSNTAVSDNETYVLSVYLTINSTDIIDGKNIGINATLADNETNSFGVNDTVEETIDTGFLKNSSVITYDDKVQTRVDVNSSAGYNINHSSINIAVKNLNTTEEVWIVKNGAIVNGTAMTGNNLDNTGNASARVEIALQEGVYNWSVVTNATDTQNNVITPNWTTFTNFTVNMSGVALNVTADNPALQDDGIAPRTAEENATINVTVMDKFDHNLVFNTSDVNTTSGDIILTKTAGTGSETITKIIPTFVYPNVTQPVQFIVSNTVAEAITLKALDTGDEGLTAGSASQEFTARIGGVDVYAADGEILADGIDYELVYLQLIDMGGSPVLKENIDVIWSIESQGAAGATVNKGTQITNTSGIATLNITSATVSGVTMTITGLEGFTGSSYSDSATVLTKAGEVNDTNSKLCVNETLAPGATQGTVNTTMIVGVLLKDSSDNIIVGKTVTLTANTTASFIDSTPMSDANGWANTTIRLPTDVNVTMVRAITREGNLSVTPPELNQTVNVTSTPDVVTQIGVSPSKSIGMENVNGTEAVITIQLQDTYGNDNTTATADILITTTNPDLGNMSFSETPGTKVNNNLWCNISTDDTGSETFTYTVNSSTIDTATLTVNVTDYDFTDTITITTSGPTGLNLTVNPMLPLVGQTVTATAQLTSEVGDIAIAGVNITFILKNATNPYIEISENYTDATGKTTYSITQTTRGEYTIKATNSSYSISATNTTLTYVGNATNILIAVNNTSPAVDETITVYAIFKDDAGYNSSSEDAPPGVDGVRFLANDELFDTDNTITNGVASVTYSHGTAETVDLAVYFNNATKSLTLVDSMSVEWVGVGVHTVTGTVTGINQEAISGATVTINGHTDTTDTNGNYAILNVPTGTYTVTANATGYGDETKTGVSIAAATTIDFTGDDGLLKECPVTTTYVLQVVNRWAAGEISSTTKVLQQVNIWAACT